MGIKEHFEKNPEGDLKLQEITVDLGETERELFDVDKQVTVKEWTDVAKDLGDYAKKKSGFQDYAGLATQIKIVSRDHFDELVEVPARVFRYLKKSTESHIRGGNWVRVMKLVWWMKNIVPEKMNEFDSSVIADGMKGQLEQYREEKKWQPYAVMAMYFRLLFPERVDGIDLGDEVLQNVKADLDEVADDADAFVLRAAAYKIAFGQRAEDLKLDENFEKMVKGLLDRRRRTSSTKRFFEGVANIKIIMADEVVVTDDGLKLVKKKPDLKQEKVPRPERKKF